jgi:hypothetical protein
MSEPVSLQQAHLAHQGDSAPRLNNLDALMTWATSSSMW